MAGGRLWQFLPHHVVSGSGQTDPCRLQTLSCSGVLSVSTWCSEDLPTSQTLAIFHLLLSCLYMSTLPWYLKPVRLSAKI